MYFLHIFIRSIHYSDCINYCIIIPYVFDEDQATELFNDSAASVG